MSEIVLLHWHKGYKITYICIVLSKQNWTWFFVLSVLRFSKNQCFLQDSQLVIDFSSGHTIKKFYCPTMGFTYKQRQFYSNNGPVPIADFKLISQYQYEKWVIYNIVCQNALSIVSLKAGNLSGKFIVKHNLDKDEVIQFMQIRMISRPVLLLID